MFVRTEFTLTGNVIGKIGRDLMWVLPAVGILELWWNDLLPPRERSLKTFQLLDLEFWVIIMASRGHIISVQFWELTEVCPDLERKDRHTHTHTHTLNLHRRSLVNNAQYSRSKQFPSHPVIKSPQEIIPTTQCTWSSGDSEETTTPQPNCQPNKAGLFEKSYSV